MTTRQRIHVGARVEGSHGNLVTNPNGNKRRVRERVTGTVLSAAGEHKWKVNFDFNGKVQEVTSKSLKVIEKNVGLPLNQQVSCVQLNSIDAIK